MFKDLSKALIEGASIVLVMEDADAGQLGYQISYPIPEGGSDFPECTVIFVGVSRYAVETRGTGQPVIQRVEIVERAAFDIVVRIHTDQGLREVSCRAAKFREGPFSQPN